jgi:mannose-1-phosphate guanylyltransferase
MDTEHSDTTGILSGGNGPVVSTWGRRAAMKHILRGRGDGGSAYRQAVILVGGEGTRLRPITSRVPKPTAPLMGRPFISYILENLVRHGVDRVVFSTGYLAATIEAEIGDGSSHGLEARYAFEDSPLGTAGAIRNAASELAPGGFLVFNGDVLTDVDLTALVAFHKERHGAATLLTTEVEDARRYGLVEAGGDGRISRFLEKPGADRRGPGLINAGVYVLEPDVLELIPPGRQFSVERGVFPALAARGRLYSFLGRGYWRDIGTPQSYLEAHFDMLRDSLVTGSPGHVGGTLSVSDGAHIEPGAVVVPPVHVARGAVICANARVGPWTVVGRDSRVGPGAHIVASVLQDDVSVGRDAVVEHSVIVRRATIGGRSQLRDVVIGEGCDIGEGNVLANGLDLFPQAVVPDHSVKFRGAEGALLDVPSLELAPLEDTA